MTDKLDPLPWFAFNIGDYVKDTMRLTTEAHGAYLLLMLDYYGTGAPCPDDDYVLAAVTKLTEERWKQVRRSLQPLFDVREGHWFHSRIEREMREASERHAKRLAAAHAGNDARWGKEQPKPAQSTASRSRNTARAPKNANRMPDAVRVPLPNAMPSQSDCDPHSTLTPPYNRGGEEAPPEADQNDLEVGPIPKDFTPDPATSDIARAAGMTVAEIDAEVRKFILKRQGQLGDDWQGSFALWIEREMAYRAKQAAKAPPRIEVNNRVSSVSAAPTEGEFDRQVAMFTKGMPWSSQLGPEPGHIGCRVPPAILDRHGIDPKTGLKRKVSA